MPRFKINTNSFTISHYILLFLVTGVCIGILGWIMINRHTSGTPNNNIGNIIHITDANPCVQRTINTVKQMWNQDPKTVPEKYWDIAINYMNQPINENMYGICNDVAYTCRRGQIRRDCDPCVVPSARQYAQSVHVADLIQTNCQGNK